MKDDAAEKYCTLMNELKKRQALMKRVGEGHVPWLVLEAQMEFVYLQFRQILELIAMASLVANADAFRTIRENIHTYWNAEKLLKDLAAANPHFYPKPINKVASAIPGVRESFVDRKDDFLSKEKFVTLYNTCGSVLHSRNPFAQPIDYQTLNSNAPKWYFRITNLLNFHTIQLVGSDDLHLIQMGDPTQSATYQNFVKTAPPWESTSG